MSAPRSSWLERAVPATLLRREGALVCLVAWVFLLAIPWSMGGFGLSWDALNHHIYLGWTAEQHRFDRDFVAAGYQSFQSPYLYWPIYRMAVAGWSGLAAGVVLASLHLVAVWPLWMLARACVPGTSLFDAATRWLAVALGLLSCVVLSAFGASMNDLLAAAPLLWAVALALEPVARGADMAPGTVWRWVLLSGLCAGLAVGLKLSNGPLAILMPGLWFLCGSDWRQRLRAVTTGCLATLAGFLLGYGHWGWLLWRHFGNPVHPFDHPWFGPLRAWLLAG